MSSTRPTLLPSPQLDHIVIHVPFNYLSSPPSWLTKLFTITPGGTHTDGRTANSLIAFSDGTYLELIAFTPETTPEQKSRHPWGTQPYGIIDWALTLPSQADQGGEARRQALMEEQYHALRQRWNDLSVSSKWKASDPKPQGRTKPDGTELKWLLASSPERGVIPFWCLDVTPRTNRVPGSSSQTSHPSGARGISEVTLRVTADDDDARREVTEILHAAIPQSSEDPRNSVWTVATPGSVDSAFNDGNAALIRLDNEDTDGKTGRKDGVKQLLFRTAMREQVWVTGAIEGDEIVLGFLPA